jgi:hypothetical protein
MPLPSLAHLRVAPTAAGGNAPINHLPQELWKVILEKISNAGAEWDENLSREIVKLCGVAKGAPWEAVWEAACGDEGWIYDQANQILGLYGDYPDWAALQEWIGKRRIAELRAADRELERVSGDNKNTSENSKTPWWSSPKVYFQRCMITWKTKGVANDPWSSQTLRGYARDSLRPLMPWSRAFIVQHLRKTPGSFPELYHASMLLPIDEPRFANDWVRRLYYADLRKDYIYIAKDVMAHNPEQLVNLPRSIQFNTHIVVQGLPSISVRVTHPEITAPMFPEYAELAKIAVQQDGWMLKHVPGSLNETGTHTSGSPIEEYTEVALLAVKQQSGALLLVPGSLTHEKGAPVADPVRGYEEIARVAVAKDPGLLEWVPASVRAVLQQ